MVSWFQQETFSIIKKKEKSANLFSDVFDSGYNAVHVGKSRASNMATSTGKDGKTLSISDVDLLLHPELLSQEFMQLILREVS